MLFGTVRIEADGRLVLDVEARRLLDPSGGEGSLEAGGLLASLAEALQEGARAVREGAPCWTSQVSLADDRVLEVLVHRDPQSAEAPLYGLLQDVTRRLRREGHSQRLQRLEALSDLSGGLAHEFNNIVTAILGLTDLLSLDARDTPSRVLLGQIQSAARRGVGLTHQLLTFSRRQPRQDEICDPSEVFAAVLELARQTFPRSVEIVEDLKAGPCTMECDASQLRHAFLNLALNARDALPDGQGVVVFRSSILEMDPEHEDLFPDAGPGRYLLYEVGDTGRGIPPEVQAHLFQPFFTTQDASRTGLGLATTYGVVRSHGGHVTFVTEPGVGTRFLVLLPYSPTPAAAAPAPHAERPAHPSAPSAAEEEPDRDLILFVDDEEAIRLFAGAALRRRGYRALTARNGIEALELLQAHTGEIKLVLLDLTMPMMGGAETFEKIQELDMDVRVVVMSGYGPDERTERMLSRGALAFLPKPFDVHELLVSVESALRAPAVHPS